MKILLIEDYTPLRESMEQGLRENGYAVDAADDGEEGFWYANTGKYDLIVLDLMLPGMEGLEILRRLREKQDKVHVLILTALDTLEDKVEGLDLGADDYLTKPFEFKELLARVRAIIRRKYDQKSPSIVIADLEVDTVKRTAIRNGRPLNLTSREYAILELLASRAGRVVSRGEIREGIYDFASESASNVIDVYVGRLRRKLEISSEKRLLHTRRGYGYLLEDDV